MRDRMSTCFFRVHPGNVTSNCLIHSASWLPSIVPGFKQRAPRTGFVCQSYCIFFNFTHHCRSYNPHTITRIFFQWLPPSVHIVLMQGLKLPLTNIGPVIRTYRTIRKQPFYHSSKLARQPQIKKGTSINKKTLSMKI